MCGNGKEEMVTQSGATEDQAAHIEMKPLALVYRGPVGCDGCSEVVAQLLLSSRWDFEVKYVGPKEILKLSAATLQSAVLYAQPGAAGSLSRAYRKLRDYARDIRNFVSSGGRYLGICMGGYLAGSTPGFHLLPGDTDQFIASHDASVRTAADTLVQVKWRDQLRWMYFQDGPFFRLHSKASGVTVLARYTNGKVAALVAPYGKGKVGVVGPHPEADASWFTDSRLVIPGDLDFQPGLNLIDTLML
jgi:glutamine amidotransferase-like uncharacterized protein